MKPDTDNIAHLRAIANSLQSTLDNDLKDAKHYQRNQNIFLALCAAWVRGHEEGYRAGQDIADGERDLEMEP